MLCENKFVAKILAKFLEIICNKCNGFPQFQDSHYRNIIYCETNDSLYRLKESLSILFAIKLKVMNQIYDT